MKRRRGVTAHVEKDFAIIGRERLLPVDIYYEVYGSGPKKILFIIGYITCFYMWEDQIQFFKQKPEEFQVCVFDNRGIGRSKNSVVNLSTRDFALDTLELADHLGWDQFHAVGLSLGGMILQEVVLLAPSRILSLVFGVCHEGVYLFGAKVSGILRAIEHGMVAGHKAKVKTVLRMLFSPEYYESHMKELVRWKMSKWEDPAVTSVLSNTRALLTHAVSTQGMKCIRELSVPKVVVGSGKDCLFASSTFASFAKGIDARYELFEGSGHMVQMEYSAEFNRIIVDNVRTVDPKPIFSSPEKARSKRVKRYHKP